jgi:hypothetical protein
MPDDHVDALLTEAATALDGAYLTLAAVGHDRRETQLARRAVGDARTLRAWLARALTEHRASHPKLRLRLWGPGGRPIRGSVIPAIAASPPGPAAPDSVARSREAKSNGVAPPACAQCATLATRLSEARRRISELDQRLQESLSRNQALLRRVRQLRLERDALEATARQGLTLAAMVNAAFPEEDVQ